LGAANYAFPAGLAYPPRTQRPDGSWLPLWFGNQHAPDDENPTLCTARVLPHTAISVSGLRTCTSAAVRCSLHQNADGGWRVQKVCPSSVEESSLAVEILLDAACDPIARATP